MAKWYFKTLFYFLSISVQDCHNFGSLVSEKQKQSGWNWFNVADFTASSQTQEAPGCCFLANDEGWALPTLAPQLLAQPRTCWAPCPVIFCHFPYVFFHSIAAPEIISVYLLICVLLEYKPWRSRDFIGLTHHQVCRTLNNAWPE